MPNSGPHAWHAQAINLVSEIVVGAIAAYGGLVERTKTPVE
jgi:hypothetical protein